jgi:hypothetical protein
MGDPNVKRVRETRFWGEGECEIRVTRDFLDIGADTTISFGSGNTASWGDSAVWGDAEWAFARAISPTLVRKARRGTVFSIEFSHATLGETWAVHRADHHVDAQRVSSVPRTEVVNA